MAGALKNDIESLDRRMKWWLLLVSLATLALLVLAALAENVYPQWRQTRLAYARILDREATDARGQSIAGQFNPEPDQHVLRELRRVDRCVTCHSGVEDPRMADQPQPFRTHPGEILASHPLKKFGCTICHQGQGSATALPDAHGNVHFWAEPMIPTRYAYAGCGTCHTSLDVPNLAELQRGRNLVERHDCLACHRIDGRGGTLRPGGVGGMEGPNLSRVGVGGFDPKWYENHLKQSQQAKGLAQKRNGQDQTSEVSKTSEVSGTVGRIANPSYKDSPWTSAFDPIEPAARKAIEVFLTSRVGAPRLVEAKAMFHTLGCLGCHKIGGVGGDDGPDLTHAGHKDPARIDFSHVSGERTLAQWHAEHLRDPAKIVPDSKMPKAGLSDAQVELLTLYLLSLRRKDVPETYWPKDRIRAERLGEREFATDGSTLFGTFCAGCHGRSGEGRRFPGAVPFPAVGNPDFLAAASDDFLAQTIQRGRPGRRMPAWDAKSGGLRAEEIQEIIAHLRRASGVAEPKPAHPERRWVQADAKAGEQLFVRNCAGCHGLHGEGLQAPALNHAVLQAVATDDYFVETIGRGRRGTDMNGFRNPSSVHPTLSEADIQSIVAFIRTWETQK